MTCRGAPRPRRHFAHPTGTRETSPDQRIFGIDVTLSSLSACRACGAFNAAVRLALRASLCVSVYASNGYASFDSRPLLCACVRARNRTSEWEISLDRCTTRLPLPVSAGRARRSATVSVRARSVQTPYILSYFSSDVSPRCLTTFCDFSGGKRVSSCLFVCDTFARACMLTDLNAKLPPTSQLFPRLTRWCSLIANWFIRADTPFRIRALIRYAPQSLSHDSFVMFS